MIFLYFLSGLAILQGIVALIDGIRAARFLSPFEGDKPRSSAAGGPDIAVFCPVKGNDPGLKHNIESILNQDYPRFTVYFIVESAEDPAYRTLQNAGVEHLLVAGPALDCGQKVHNLQYAVHRVPPTAEVFVFCDADARFPDHWLRNLTAPLADPDIAVSTGYRWYVADRLSLPVLLRSAWNASVVSMLGDHGRNFAWGGSMALRRQTFESLGVLDEWRGGISDDYGVTRAAQRAQARIVFVPSCLIPSHGDCSFSELLEFTTRQIVITRVYHPRMWRIGFFSQTMFNLTFFWLAAVMIWNPIALALWLTIYGLAALKSANRISAVRAALRDPSLSRFGWFYILFSPAVSLLYQYNMVRSALTREIEWRQIHYKLISPHETRVRRSSAGAS